MRLVVCAVLFAPSLALACAMPSFEAPKAVAKAKVVEARPAAEDTAARGSHLAALMEAIDAAAAPAPAAPAAPAAPTAPAPSVIPEAAAASSS